MKLRTFIDNNQEFHPSCC